MAIWTERVNSFSPYEYRDTILDNFYILICFLFLILSGQIDQILAHTGTGFIRASHEDLSYVTKLCRARD